MFSSAPNSKLFWFLPTCYDFAKQNNTRCQPENYIVIENCTNKTYMNGVIIDNSYVVIQNIKKHCSMIQYFLTKVSFDRIIEFRRTFQLSVNKGQLRVILRDWTWSGRTELIDNCEYCANCCWVVLSTACSKMFYYKIRYFWVHSLIFYTI